ncbi:MAG: hypothetical protein H6838_01850 [Planctomycetes bacterium]|nr:hypothetical protein [Planctomycetota bacterium]MCB9884201.1 hypothetical protein [Planctomycetota bacterium]
MRSKLGSQVLVFLTAAGAVCAQAVVVPAVMNGVEGGGGTNIPFGSNLACRYQCIYDAQELPWTGPRLITGISIRADNGSPTTPGLAIAAKGFVELSVLMSTTYKDSSTISGTFAQNRGVDATWVMQSERIMLPAQAVTATPGPRPANIDLNFTTPWFYGLTPGRPNQPPPGNLLVEIFITSQPAGSYRIDNLSGCQAAAADFGNQGPTCLLPGQAQQPPDYPTLTTSPSMLAGGSFGWTVSHVPANAPFLLMINGTNQGGLFGQPSMPLPYPLFDPLNPSQPPAGLTALRWPAPDCWLNIDPIGSSIGVCDASGTGTVATQVPSGRQYVGLTIYGQAIALAPTANQLGVLTTLGRHSTVCGPLGVTRNYTFFDNSTSPPPPTSGTLQHGSGMVIEVR